MLINFEAKLSPKEEINNKPDYLQVLDKLSKNSF